MVVGEQIKRFPSSLRKDPRKWANWCFQSYFWWFWEVQPCSITPYEEYDANQNVSGVPDVPKFVLVHSLIILLIVLEHSSTWFMHIFTKNDQLSFISSDCTLWTNNAHYTCIYNFNAAISNLLRESEYMPNFSLLHFVRTVTIWKARTLKEYKTTWRKALNCFSQGISFSIVSSWGILGCGAVYCRWLPTFQF